ncbi:prepilin-type N-terminal cleavage/methylation domain-containing protein [Candidatus Saccharibacteria bacterium]|nr:prepilin-type N-terminal cleavage/methylation domain-containing protein [Candidatus Saccharibacteria bacterium]
MHSVWAKQKAFTIVELLIVIVVIAILAAITIVAYTGIQDRAKASAAQAAAKQAFTKIQGYAIENAENYPASPSAAGLATGSGTTYEYRYDNTVNPKTFCLTATTNNVSYYVSSTTSAPTAGACAGHGVNGVAAITNLIPNPSIESSTSGYSASRSTVATSNAWAGSGSYSLRQTPTDSGSTDSFVSVGGDVGALRLGMEAGKTYTFSATLRLSAAQTGTLFSGARTIRAFTKTASTSYVSNYSATAPNQAGTTRLSTTFTIPVDATEAFLRLYSGALVNGGDSWWDDLMLTEGSSTPSFADGSSPGWIWNGTPNNSTSTGPPL